MDPSATPVAPTFFKLCLDLHPPPSIWPNAQQRKIINININDAELLIYTRWASQPLTAVCFLSGLNLFQPCCVESWLLSWLKQFRVEWWKKDMYLFLSNHLNLWPIKKWDGANLLGPSCVSPSLYVIMIHGTQNVKFAVASSVFPLQPMNWATQSPSQDLFIYTRS